MSKSKDVRERHEGKGKEMYGRGIGGVEDLGGGRSWSARKGEPRTSRSCEEWCLSELFITDAQSSTFREQGRKVIKVNNLYSKQLE